MDTNDTNSKSKAGALSLSKLLKNNISSEKEKREKKIAITNSNLKMKNFTLKINSK